MHRQLGQMIQYLQQHRFQLGNRLRKLSNLFRISSLPMKLETALTAMNEPMNDDPIITIPLWSLD